VVEHGHHLVEAKHGKVFERQLPNWLADGSDGPVAGIRLRSVHAAESMYAVADKVAHTFTGAAWLSAKTKQVMKKTQKGRRAETCFRVRHVPLEDVEHVSLGVGKGIAHRPANGARDPAVVDATTIAMVTSSIITREFYGEKPVRLRVGVQSLHPVDHVDGDTKDNRILGVRVPQLQNNFMGH
jgi:hypothetical protein